MTIKPSPFDEKGLPYINRMQNECYTMLMFQENVVSNVDGQIDFIWPPAGCLDYKFKKKHLSLHSDELN